MKTVALLLLLALLLVSGGRAADPQSRPDPAPATAPTAPSDEPQGPVRFGAVHVYVDSGDKPLAAYQVEVTAKTGNVTLVGLEGGDHAAFKPAPYYDPRALLHNKVIVAAFSTASDLPRGRTRVATLMVQVVGNVEPTYAATLHTAASGDGKEISAHASVTPAVPPAGMPPTPVLEPSEGAKQ